MKREVTFIQYSKKYKQVKEYKAILCDEIEQNHQIHTENEVDTKKQRIHNARFYPLKITKNIQEHLDFLVNASDADKEKIARVLNNMQFYIEQLNEQGIRYSQNIERIISKLQTAQKVINEVEAIKTKPNKRMIAKLETTKETLIELLRIYQIQNKYVIFSDTDTELFTKHPIFDALKAIDFILIGEKHSIDIKQIIAQQIGYLQRAVVDRDVIEDGYCFDTHDSAIYYTLLNNLQGMYKTTYNTKDIVLIAYTMIYEVFATSEISIERSFREDTAIFLSNILNDLKIKVDLTSPTLDVLSIDCKGEFFMAVPTLYLEHHGQKFNKEERQKISKHLHQTKLKKSDLIFYRNSDKHVIYTIINYTSNKLHIRL